MAPHKRGMAKRPMTDICQACTSTGKRNCDMRAAKAAGRTMCSNCEQKRRDQEKNGAKKLCECMETPVTIDEYFRSLGKPVPIYPGSYGASPQTGYPGPSMGYQTPPTGYGMPSAGFGMPSMGYGMLPMGYGMPQMGYGMPQMGWAMPQMSYGMPPTGHGTPSMGYGMPQMPPADREADRARRETGGQRRDRGQAGDVQRGQRQQSTFRTPNPNSMVDYAARSARLERERKSRMSDEATPTMQPERQADDTEADDDGEAAALQTMHERQEHVVDASRPQIPAEQAVGVQPEQERDDSGSDLETWHDALEN
ncbi:hypothetical protein KC360_g660 [Hortaea werneckii]|nr:hypothetical protein KC361_g892 [Hortaea werneckii]KAI6888803.1 hypothetical protein KC325_g995 [Hortaea werneckii]KAI7000293.1 hypothetical protein KC359_g1284 [Hortaea werneckii]KAI7149976.1 hypothetical protein KC344_g553 [Hortaea werneckii]KAI7179722.1 hypothetical protein KC360_g660 [Hortaea werneckii]